MQKIEEKNFITELRKLVWFNSVRLQAPFFFVSMALGIAMDSEIQIADNYYPSLDFMVRRILWMAQFLLLRLSFLYLKLIFQTKGIDYKLVRGCIDKSTCEPNSYPLPKSTSLTKKEKKRKKKKSYP